MLNNQPMGFYGAHTLVKDAQRHGLHFLPVDVAVSDWLYSIEKKDDQLMVRQGFNYVQSFSELTGRAIVYERHARPFTSIDDLKRRVPEISRKELTTLADLGALNNLGRRTHRRDALWNAELALRPVSELLENAVYPEIPSPLRPMTSIERLQADFSNSGLSIGPHPMRFCRDRLDAMRVVPAARLCEISDGRTVSVAGAVICRQQPGTAKGFVFLSLEDETGIANIILKPDVFQRLRKTVLGNSYLIVSGTMQNQKGTFSVKATDIRPCIMPTNATPASHDFH